MTVEFFSGIFSGALITGIVGAFTLKFHYRELYAKSISSSRMHWINNFRKELSIVIATLKTKKNVYEAEKARAKLLTRINMDISKPGNEYNGVFEKMLFEIDFNNLSNVNVDNIIEKLTEVSRKILEYEWKRVKEEAGGRK